MPSDSTDENIGPVHAGNEAEKRYLEKRGAVQEWDHALEQLPDGEAWADELWAIDIHDCRQRMEAEEITEHDVPTEHYDALHDAFDSIKRRFDQ